MGTLLPGPFNPPTAGLSYPQVQDANGAMIDLQGIQKVRTYAMPALAVRELNTDGQPFGQGTTGCIVCDQAGTATITDASGHTTEGFPLEKGRNDIAVQSIKNVSGPTKIWGLY